MFGTQFDFVTTRWLSRASFPQRTRCKLIYSLKVTESRVRVIFFAFEVYYIFWKTEKLLCVGERVSSVFRERWAAGPWTWMCARARAEAPRAPCAPPLLLCGDVLDVGERAQSCISI